MSVLYNKNGVYIDDAAPGTLRFGSRTLSTKSSNRGGDTVLRDKGFHNAYAKSDGLFSSKYNVVLSYYFPDGEPDEVVWTAQDRREADEIAAAINAVLG